MSWELASFALLGLVLVAGFAWYERAHPSARVLALVATMAALAVLGRVAFAALPNVKPTTDLVLLTGYTLGGAPGFAVGAVTALVSNLFFGQGPWTPWQMGAWGLVGAGGAALALVSRRRLGRVPLALCCGVAGLVYGAILDYSTWVTFSGEHTLGQYLAIAGTALPFNVAHAAGNIVFCLAFGPALVRALLRFRARFEVTWRPLPAGRVAAGPAALGVLLAAVALTAGATALTRPGDARAASRDPAIGKAVAYLERAQNADGGFGGAPKQASDGLHTSWAVMGLAAAGKAPAAVRSGGKSPVDALVAGARRVREIGDLERTILALHAAGVDPRRVGGRDLVAALLRKRSASGAFAGLVNQTSFAILALRAAGRRTGDQTVQAAARWVARQQNPDGGFNFASKGGQSGIDDTAGALQALVAAGKASGGQVRRAASFLAAQQGLDGGFPLTPGGASNAQSTAWAIQALVAAHRDPDGLHRKGAHSPVEYLRSLQGADGAIHYSRTSRQSPVWVTASALTALARTPLPIRAVSGGRAAAGGSRSAATRRVRAGARGRAPGSASGGAPSSQGAGPKGAAGAGAAPAAGPTPARQRADVARVRAIAAMASRIRPALGL